MAKRGYRGKHPHNDMKVSNNPKSSKHSAKLISEYNNLPEKQKYSYIRTNYIYPQASCTIVCHANIANNDACTLVSTKGLSLEYTAKGSNSFGSRQFKQNDTSGAGEAINTAINLKSAIEHASGHNGELIVSRDGATLTITQRDPGPDGNTTVTKTNSWTGATVPSAFTGG